MWVVFVIYYFVNNISYWLKRPHLWCMQTELCSLISLSRWFPSSQLVGCLLLVHLITFFWLAQANTKAMRAWKIFEKKQDIIRPYIPIPWYTRKCPTERMVVVVTTKKPPLVSAEDPARIICPTLLATHPFYPLLLIHSNIAGCYLLFSGERNQQHRPEYGNWQASNKWSAQKRRTDLCTYGIGRIFPDSSSIACLPLSLSLFSLLSLHLHSVA